LEIFTIFWLAQLLILLQVDEGIDVNQPSRLRSAAELRLLLSFNSDISNGLRQQLNNGLEQLSVNPLENGIQAERGLALARYHNLKAYALRPDGLPGRVERERAENRRDSSVVALYC
jgi:hypothetical protein